MPNHQDPAVNADRIRRANERAMAARYTIAIVLRSGEARLRGCDKAPADATLIKWAVNLKAGFVTRFYPSKKGWLLIDVRNA